MTVRAASAAATRLTILRAACEVYAREGFHNASMQAIAREADVSPATVLNHFGSSDKILAPALALLSSELGLADPAALDMSAPLEQRISRLVHHVVGVYRKNGKWSEVYARARDMPAVRKAARAFFSRVEALVRAELGRLANPKRVAVVMALVAPANVFALEAAGMPLDEVADTIAEVITCWLDTRRRAKR